MDFPSWGKIKNINWVVARQRSGFRALFIGLAGTIISFLATSLMAYGYLAINDPDKIINIIANKEAFASMLIGAGIIVSAFTVGVLSLGKSDFAKNSFEDVYFKKLQTMREENVPLYDSRVNEAIDKIMHPFEYGAGSQDTLFEKYISGILRSLSGYASRSEETATKLLDKGVAFMAGGLLFYVVAIIVWQFYAKLASPVEYLLYIGMIACSTTFLVIEFLAAWFFKQYRYYVDVSMSCLRVRSVYDRYLLSFYALKEFEAVDASSKMLEILREDVKWPSYQATTRNDFNHMIETVAVLNNSLDKAKDIFKRKKTGPEGK